MEYFNSLKSWALTTTGTIALSSSLVLLTALRLYASGGRCRATRDLINHVVVITGANTGIGKQTMRVLARSPCTIYFGARDARKSEEAIKEILKENKKARIFYFPLDLADKASIKEFSERVKGQVEKIDMLINNAGVMAIPDRRVTVDGYEMQMGTNHFGHFYLTALLWEKLKKAEEFRVINVSSGAHRHSPSIDFEDINFTRGYHAGEAYGRTKGANILFTRLLQKKIDEAGLNGITVSLHPGVVRTELTRYMTWKMQVLIFVLKPLIYLLMKSPLEGAQTTLHLALENTTNIRKGEYYKDCKPKQTTPFCANLENAERLWTVTERELGIEFKI